MLLLSMMQITRCLLYAAALLVQMTRTLLYAAALLDADDEDPPLCCCSP